MFERLRSEVGLLGECFNQHSKNVELYGVAMLKTLQVQSNETKYKEINIERFRDALILHDIGKLMVPDKILFKTTNLQFEEFNVIKRHPLYGEQIFRDELNKIKGKVQSDDRDMILSVIKYHHERIDGTGYPYGLNGQEIPDVAKIAQIADAYDAITSDRQYSRGKSINEALSIINLNSGKQFDSNVVALLMRDTRWTSAANPYKQTVLYQIV